jgi:hypothetical protein
MPDREQEDEGTVRSDDQRDDFELAEVRKSEDFPEKTG